MVPARERPHEEGGPLVAEFHVGTERVSEITATDVDRLEATGLHVFENQVLVVVLAVNFEFDLDEVAARDFRQVRQFGPFVFLDFLFEGLAP
ncbi:MAG: hypothetical protein B7Z55_16940 [Planctomycetales bacterium 12-60-4]|nr:MAG: hypothetical protein B7Z55_16940 [Planctomycetales bacterium 12-60-4]